MEKRSNKAPWGSIIFPRRKVKKAWKGLILSQMELCLMSPTPFLPVLNLVFGFFSCRGAGFLVMWFCGKLPWPASNQLLFLGWWLAARRELRGGGDGVECGHLGSFDHTVPASRGHQVGESWFVLDCIFSPSTTTIHYHTFPTDTYGTFTFCRVSLFLHNLELRSVEHVVIDLLLDILVLTLSKGQNRIEFQKLLIDVGWI